MSWLCTAAGILVWRHRYYNPFFTKDRSESRWAVYPTDRVQGRKLMHRKAIGLAGPKGGGDRATVIKPQSHLNLVPGVVEIPDNTDEFM